MHLVGRNEVMYLLLFHTFEHTLAVVLSSLSAVNVSLGSTATFTGLSTGLLVVP